MARSSADAGDPLDKHFTQKMRIVELLDDEENIVDGANDDEPMAGLPFPGKKWLQQQGHWRSSDLPLWLQPDTLLLIHDDLDTTTSQAQDKVTQQCVPLLTSPSTQGLPLNRYNVPHLRRQEHAKFLHGTMDSLPAAYQAADASRPWIFYWALVGLSCLGEDVSLYRKRLMETVRPLQNVAGGFGGGHGQLSHCACSYSTILALATVDGLAIIDRNAMWQWLGTIKQTNGGFCMAVGGEEDIRGAYCAMVIISLLNLPLTLPPDSLARKAGLNTFTDRLGEWIGQCQTFEGGIGGAPTNEAHGAYAFCALACLSILDAPDISIPRYLDMHALLTWLAGIQTSPEGGFAGRTNKLVDACYSHWVGGCWALLQAALSSPSKGKPAKQSEDCWSRQGLIRYLLCCCQQTGKYGGMRDKPSTRPDGYHTCYSLVGLSAAQNHYYYDAQAGETKAEPSRLNAAFHWRAKGATEGELEAWRVDEADVVDFVHPVFVIPMDAVERTFAAFTSSRDE